MAKDFENELLAYLYAKGVVDKPSKEDIINYNESEPWVDIDFDMEGFQINVNDNLTAFSICARQLDECCGIAVLTEMESKVKGRTLTLCLEKMAEKMHTKYGILIVTDTVSGYLSKAFNGQPGWVRSTPVRNPNSGNRIVTYTHYGRK